MTAIALDAPTRPFDEWPELAWPEPLDHVRAGDSTYENARHCRTVYRQRLAELQAAIVRAEHWYAARCDQLAAVDRRAAHTTSRLVAAGQIRAR